MHNVRISYVAARTTYLMLPTTAYAATVILNLGQGHELETQCYL